MRLDGIDAPESGQEFGPQAKQFMHEAASTRLSRSGGTRLTIWRLIAQVTADGRDLSVAAVEAGFAWHFIRHSNNPSSLPLRPVLARKDSGCGRSRTRNRRGPTVRSRTSVDYRLRTAPAETARPRFIVAATAPPVSSRASCRAEAACSRDQSGSARRKNVTPG